VLFDVVDIRIPMVIRIEDIGERPVADMGGLRRGMGGVARGGDDDPGGAAEKAEDLGDGIAEALKKMIKRTLSPVKADGGRKK